MSAEFVRHVDIQFPFDKTATGHGVGSLRIWMVLKGPEGAVQFAFSAGSYLPHVLEKFRHNTMSRYLGEIEGVDVGYHSPRPMHDGQTTMGPCEHLDGKPCYYDGSSLWAQELLEEALRRGNPPEYIWSRLEEIYNERFNKEEQS